MVSDHFGDNSWSFLDVCQFAKTTRLNCLCAASLARQRAITSDEVVEPARADMRHRDPSDAPIAPETGRDGATSTRRGGAVDAALPDLPTTGVPEPGGHQPRARHSSR